MVICYEFMFTSSGDSGIHVKMDRDTGREVKYSV